MTEAKNQRQIDAEPTAPATKKYCSPGSTKAPECYHIVSDPSQCPRAKGELIERSEQYLLYHDIADQACEYCASE